MMHSISDERIRATLAPYGFVPDQVQIQAIRSHISILLIWNQRISLTTIVDPIEILRFHFGESVYAAVCVPILKGRLADVGSGAGFPGLALKIALPDLSLTLIESNMKKAAFLREVIQELGLQRSEVIRSRMEDLPDPPILFDFISARALGRHATTLEWARSRLTSTGRVVLWLGEQDIPPLLANSHWKWGEPARIPGSERRFILSGSPLR